MPHEEVEEKIIDITCFTPIFHFQVNNEFIKELIESNKIIYLSTIKINLN